MAFEKLKETLERNGFQVSVFATGEEAATYLNREIDGITVGMGGSMTIADLGLKESLSTHNVVFSHGYTPCSPEECQAMAAAAEVYILSANGIAEDTGEILNIDGNGNRGGLLPLRPPEGLLCGREEQGVPGLCQRPPPGAERGGPQERPAAEAPDPLRRQGGPLLRLPQPRPDLPGPGGILPEDPPHGHGGGAGGPGAGVLIPRQER